MILTTLWLCKLTKGGFPEANAGAPFQNLNQLTLLTWHILFHQAVLLAVFRELNECANTPKEVYCNSMI